MIICSHPGCSAPSENEASALCKRHAFDRLKRNEIAASRSGWRSGQGERVRQVLNHPGFVELSRWNDLKEPWGVGLRLGASHVVTWFRGHTLEEAVGRALLGVELLGSEAA